MNSNEIRTKFLEYFQSLDDCNNNIFYESNGFLIGNCIPSVVGAAYGSQLASCNSTTCNQYTWSSNTNCSGTYTTSTEMSHYELNECFNDNGLYLRVVFLEGGTGYDSLGSGLQMLTYSEVMDGDCDSIMALTFNLNPASICVDNTIIECDDGTADYTIYEGGQDCSGSTSTLTYSVDPMICLPGVNNTAVTQYCAGSSGGGGGSGTDDSISTSSTSSTSLGSGAIAGITITVILVVFGAVAVLLYYIYPSVFGLGNKTKHNVEMNRESINPMGNNLNTPLNA